ncbi:hypothetical protein [Kitasatospora sp. McL0602]|uniref:hypothetical protein n=1 Tax=Kitasatospora sp. McL0602 TaxID=3439530 RepID=UPI003F8C0423
MGEQSGQLSQASSAVSGISLSGSAFGHLPNAGHLHQMYSEHADANRKNLADLVDAMNQTASGLTSTAQNYAQHDQQLSEGLGGAR